MYTLWESGLTIDEISAHLNIPRSTVGYYVRKSNRYASSGKPLVIPRYTKNRQEVIASFPGKLLTGNSIVAIFNSGPAVTAVFSAIPWVLTFLGVYLVMDYPRLGR